MNPDEKRLWLVTFEAVIKRQNAIGAVYEANLAVLEFRKATQPAPLHVPGIIPRHEGAGNCA